MGHSPDRIRLLSKTEASDIKVFFSANIFIIKQSMLLTFLRLLRIVSSSDSKHKKRESWLWAFSLILRKLWSKSKWIFWYAALRIRHIGNKRLCKSSLKKSFEYQIAEFCCHYKFWVKGLTWRKSGCNKLTKISCKLRFYYIMVMKTF